MAALLTFLVVCSVAALVVAIYAANKEQPRYSDLLLRHEIDAAHRVLRTDIERLKDCTGLGYRYMGEAPHRNHLYWHDQEIARIKRQLAPSPAPKPNTPEPTLADRLAALEAKGKKR